MKDVYEEIDIGFKSISEYDPEPKKPPIPPRKIITPIITVIGIIGTIIGIYFLTKYIGNHFEEIQAFIHEAFIITDENGEEIPIQDKMIEIAKTILPITISLIGIKTGIYFIHHTIKDI